MEAFMINNYEQNFREMQEQMNELINYLENDWQNLEIHTTEKNIFQALLKIGKNALSAFVLKKGTGKEQYKTDIPYNSKKNWEYISIFGSINFERAYFWQSGLNKGMYPLDKELNLPKKHYSYLLQKWNQMIAVEDDYDKARKHLEEIFQINVWSKQSEEINNEVSQYVKQYYKDNPEGKQKEPILVVQTDGKGVIMRKEKKSGNRKIRLKKGEKNGTKKMATVTAVYGIERNVRTVDDIVKHEVDKSGKKSNKKQKLKIVTQSGPRPKNKIVRATLESKQKGFERIIEEINHRDPENQCERVILMDGERALEKKAKKYLFTIGFIFILDLFHVMERLWQLCYFFCEEASDESVLWVKKYLSIILYGKAGYFIGAIRQIVTKGKYTDKKKEQIEKLLSYFVKRKEYMKYNEYLSKGYPIGSGVIEGTCRSLVKDRMELSGMRWSKAGAESMLELRSIKVNGKWDDFWDYYIEKEKHRQYSNQNNFFRKKNEIILDTPAPKEQEKEKLA
jgi:hypothetical protein